MSRLRCALAGWLPPQSKLGRTFKAHRLSCLRCQATAARRRLLVRELSALAEDLAAAPAWLAESVMSRLGLQDAIDPRRALAVRAALRHAAVGTAIVGATVAVTGIARWHSRGPA